MCAKILYFFNLWDKTSTHFFSSQIFFRFCLNHIFWQFTFHFVRWTKFHHFTTPNQQCFHSNCYSVAHSCYYFPETLIKFHLNHISAHVGALFGKILINVSSKMAHMFKFYLYFWYFEANSYQKLIKRALLVFIQRNALIFTVHFRF